MGEEEPSKWRVLFLLLSPEPSGKGSPPCSLRRKHLLCLPSAAGRPPRYSFPLLRAQRIRAAAQASAHPELLHTITAGLCSLSEMPPSHRPGPLHWCTPHAQARPWAGAASCSNSSSNPCCPPSPASSVKRVKSLLKHEKIITLVFSLAEQGCMHERKRWGSRNERIICKPNKPLCQSFPISSWFLIPWKLQPLKINLNILILGLMVWFPYGMTWGCPQPQRTDSQQLKIIVPYNIS